MESGTKMETRLQLRVVWVCARVFMCVCVSVGVCVCLRVFIYVCVCVCVLTSRASEGMFLYLL